MALTRPEDLAAALATPAVDIRAQLRNGWTATTAATRQYGKLVFARFEALNGSAATANEFWIMNPAPMDAERYVLLENAAPAVMWRVVTAVSSGSRSLNIPGTMPFTPLLNGTIIYLAK